MDVFSKEALLNIKETENVWGETIDHWVNKSYKLPCRFNLSIKWKKGNQFMGRFGGGWNYNIGVQIGGSTIILNLIVMSVRFWRSSK